MLRTYNVGETDRFCILLTKSTGKMTARAQGVRRLTSRRGSGLLPFHRVVITLEQHSFGHTVSAIECIESHSDAWHDPHAFLCAARGIELLLKLTEEGVALPDVYDLTCDFLSACRVGHTQLLVPVFTCQLLDSLGLLPSVTHSCRSHRPFEDGVRVVYSAVRGGFCTVDEEPSGRRISAEAFAVLRQLHALSLKNIPSILLTAHDELDDLFQGLIGSQLGLSLSSSPVSVSMAPGATPICQVNGRAS